MIYMIKFGYVGNNLLPLLLMATLTMAMLTPISDVKASPATTVEAGSVSLFPGETANVPITVRDIPANGGLGAYDLKVVFNPSVVEVLDVLGGYSPFNSISAENINNVAGEARFNHLIAATTGPNGTITIAYLKVRAIGTAGSSSSLGVTVISLVNAETGEEISPRNGMSGSVAILVPKSPSSISASTNEDKISVGESLTISGAISPAHQYTVTLTFTRPDGLISSGTTSPSGDGSYTYVLKPDTAGTWTVVASWPGDADHQGASSSPITFTVQKLNSSISVIISPNTIKQGGRVRIEGLVVPPSEDSTVKLDYRLREGEWTKISETRTNATGGYSYLWDTALTVPGMYEVKASWLGDLTHESAESTPSYFYVAEGSSLSISLSSTSTTVNCSIIVRGEVFPMHVYVNVTISITAPNGTMSTREVLTDVAGNYKMRFTPDSVGMWSLKASWSGDIDTDASESVEEVLVVTETGSSFSLKTANPLITIGDFMNFSGEIAPAPVGVTVTLTLTRPNSSSIILQTTSNPDGTFFLSYIPDQAGVWLVYASWDGNLDFSGSTSSETVFTVNKLVSAITLSQNPQIPKKGDLLTFEGVLNLSVSGELVNILVSDDGGKTWRTIASSETSTGGFYRASWRADRLGTFTFMAEWRGNEEYSGCVSRIVTLYIQEEIYRLKVVLPGNDETEVIMSTSSALTAFTADAANGRIKANITDPIGSSGIMNIFVPEKMLNSYGKTMFDLAFTVDDTSVTPDIVEVAGGYLITIHYTHTPRTVSLYYLTFSLTIVVKDFQNETLALANVSLTGPTRLSKITNNTGSATFRSLPGGTYQMQVYYGLIIGEQTINITQDQTIIINTTAHKTEVEYTELQTKFQNLATELNIAKIVTYLSIATVTLFIAGTSLIRKRKS